MQGETMTVTLGELFAGYGGLGMGIAAAIEQPVDLRWVSDADPIAKPGKHGPETLLEHRYPDVPNLGDITRIDWSTVEPVDIMAGGFPCQDLSLAGRRQGLRPGTRSGLWAHFAEAIDRLRPRIVVAENVRGLLSAEAHSDLEPCPFCLGDRPGGSDLRALGAVLGDLADIGYDAQWCGLRAADVGAPHGRFRIFIVATDTRHLSGRPGQRNGPEDPAGRWSFGDPGRRDRASVDLLPTPRARDFKGRDPNPRGIDLNEAVSLLPTPTATRYGNNQSPSPGVAIRPSLMLPSAVHRLLPTPTAGDSRASGNRPNPSDVSLTDAMVRGRGRLLPTPMVGSAAPAAHGQISGQFRRGMDDALASFGQYAEAVTHWAAVVDRPAPDPTIDGRLSSRFVEWMMGLPDGWVCDTPGLTRTQQLRLLGNGVVPQQAAAAIRWLLQIADLEAPT
jgi:DNA (cytosine-5)-methyltransferase 1